MSDPKNLDQLLENFLRDTHVEDNGFSDKVMAQVFIKPRLAFITNLYPVLGAVFGLFVFILAKQNLFSMNLDFFTHSFQAVTEKLSTVSSFYAVYGNYALMAVFLMTVIYLNLQPEKN